MSEQEIIEGIQVLIDRFKKTFPDFEVSLYDLYMVTSESLGFDLSITFVRALTSSEEVSGGDVLMSDIIGDGKTFAMHISYNEMKNVTFFMESVINSYNLRLHSFQQYDGSQGGAKYFLAFKAK